MPEGTEPVIEPDEPTGDDGADDKEFDSERAMKTIKAQREAEKKLKADLAEAKEKLGKFETEESAKAEAEKGLETKLAEREARIAELETSILESAVKSDFMTKAIDRGYEDPALAFLAAREQGVLGDVNKETGEVGDHDFEALEEKHPALASEGGFNSGDGGVRGGQVGKKPDQVFNGLIRKAIS